MSPHRPPVVQSLSVVATPSPSHTLVSAGQSLLARANNTNAPQPLSFAPEVDVAGVSEQLAALRRRLGLLTLGRVTGGDGSDAATWEVVGTVDNEYGQLTIALDSSSGRVTEVTCSIKTVTVWG